MKRVVLLGLGEGEMVFETATPVFRKPTGSAAFQFPAQQEVGDGPFYKQPLTYAVAGGAAMAILGGVLLFKKKR